MVEPFICINKKIKINLLRKRHRYIILFLLGRTKSDSKVWSGLPLKTLKTRGEKNYIFEEYYWFFFFIFC